MTTLYVSKSGLRVFDLSRAYGLGLLAEALGGNAKLIEHGSYFEINGDELDFEKLSKLYKYLGDDLPWKDSLRTIQGDEKKKEKFEEIKTKFSDKEFIKSLVDSHRSFNTNIWGNETLYHSIEPAAAKGIRDEIIRRSYTEGEQLKVSKEEWALAFFGHINISTWQRGEGQQLCVIPHPDHLEIKNIEILRDGMRKIRRINRAGTEVSVAQICVSLYKSAMASQSNPFMGGAKFNNMLFYSLTKTATQWKPGGLEAYPLDLINRLIESGATSQKIYEVLDIWEKIIQMGNRKGWESLALGLARTIGKPNIDNWEKYISLHLRYSKRYDFHVYYPRELMEEVIKCLEH